ncbi:winged helix-turn-helix transcriptional regulator [Sediminibacterium goheungense]|uniref:HxlR family transcriptional regulator n=1 Tax=Sediminibacterium goheungense TaxID=1086393 RepID=A0A4R6IS61_9BACT|nr:helix-turn-helix domain-containing protein [Sediminibacterium goheungense]TDO25304.1 HxlR family transcriptional regulator [Sediminibacterium goheungense]
MRKQNSTNALNEQQLTFNCPIASTLKMVGGRWKLIIIWNLREKSFRYKELQRSIPNITEKMLTQQLSSLVEDGWVQKKDYGEIPPRTEYSLTPLGKSFIAVLEHIYDWGKSNNIIGIANARYGNE